MGQRGFKHEAAKELAEFYRQGRGWCDTHRLPLVRGRCISEAPAKGRDSRSDATSPVPMAFKAKGLPSAL